MIPAVKSVRNDAKIDLVQRLLPANLIVQASMMLCSMLRTPARFCYGRPQFLRGKSGNF
jgi:hypothetical protein